MLRRIAILVGLLIAASTLSAAPRTITIKDWIFKSYDDGSAGAYTENQSGSSLGLYCASKADCTVYLTSGDGCDEGAKVPMLMSAGGGASSLSTTCKNIANAGEKPFYVNVIDDFNGVLNTMLKEHAVGFAIPMASGQFKVVRFSLEGTNEALAAVNGSLRATAKPAANRDQVL